jgi:hypothetical protein
LRASGCYGYTLVDLGPHPNPTAGDQRTILADKAAVVESRV